MNAILIFGGELILRTGAHHGRFDERTRLRRRGASTLQGSLSPARAAHLEETVCFVPEWDEATRTPQGTIHSGRCQTHSTLPALLFSRVSEVQTARPGQG